MQKTISIRIDDDEKLLIKKVAKFHNMSVSDFIKTNVIKNIEDEFDIQLADERYSEYLKHPETKDHDDLMSELGLE